MAGLAVGQTPAAAAVACPSGTESDFNGDGTRDTVIADPEATVGGAERAGSVHVVYGGGKGTLELTQALASVPDVPEPGDQFGFSLAVYDANLDGCSDLVVGIPYEDIGTVQDGGSVHLLYGATTGLGSGVAAKEFYQGTGNPLGGGQEAQDWTGYAVAAGKTSGGTPFLLIGEPGEDVGTVQDAGMIHYIHGTAQTVLGINQDTDNAGAVHSIVETNEGPRVLRTGI
ncbi:FG-GAP repeat domain-containing protein [Streptomyces sp. NPDC052023]|uniref:FG-GAP repeat domain-containing protein n=1 Tax=Streptomyces sp. NPDC052023 TaxID=3365681 RepID=UPI0037D71F33